MTIQQKYYSIGIMFFCILACALFYILYMGSRIVEKDDGERIIPVVLPQSPLDASFDIEGNEVLLQDGEGKYQSEMVKVEGDVAWGDLDGDGHDDAGMLLEITSETSFAKRYFFTVALSTAEGFLGLNAAPLIATAAPKEKIIRDELIVLIYSLGEQESLDNLDNFEHAYLRVSGATLEPAPITSQDEVMRGEVFYRDQVLSYERCDGEVFTVSRQSRGYAALTATHRERSKQALEDEENHRSYMVLVHDYSGNGCTSTSLSHEISQKEDDKLSVEEYSNEVIEDEDVVPYKELCVVAVLSAPRSGVCDAAHLEQVEME